MTTKNLIEGLQILSGYYDKQDGYTVGAEHDVIYAYPTDRELSSDDINKMIKLGWHQDYNERDYNEDYSEKDYQIEESWSFYT